MNDKYNIFNNHSQSLAIKLITSSFDNYKNNYYSRSDYFDNNIFSKLCIDDTRITTSTSINNTNDLNNFIYDILVISKLYANVYYLYLDYKNTTNNNDFQNFIKNVRIQLLKSSTENTEIQKEQDKNIYNVKIVNLFDISNLKLDTSTSRNYNSLYNIKNFDKYNDTIQKDIPIPLYHKLNDGSPFKGLSKFYSDNINKINVINTDSDTDIGRYDIINTGTDNINITFHNKNGYLTDISIQKLYEIYKNNIKTDKDNINKYNYTRILLYIDAFNIILNTDEKTILSKLKYYMYYYNAVIYNINIQYLILIKQNERLKLNNNKLIFFTNDDLNKIINNNIRTYGYTESTITNINTNIRNFIKTITDKNINTIENLDTTINTLITNIQTKIRNDITFITNKVKEPFTNLRCSVQISNRIKELFANNFIYLQIRTEYDYMNNYIVFYRVPGTDYQEPYITRFQCINILNNIFPNLLNIIDNSINITLNNININNSILYNNISSGISDNQNIVINNITNNYGINTNFSNYNDISLFINMWKIFMNDLYIFYCILIIKYNNIDNIDNINNIDNIDNINYINITNIIKCFNDKKNILNNNLLTNSQKIIPLDTINNNLDNYIKKLKNYLLSEINKLYIYLLRNILEIDISFIYNYSIDEPIKIRDDPLIIPNTEPINTHEINTEITDTINNYNAIINTASNIVNAYSKYYNKSHDKYNKFKESDNDYNKEKGVLNKTIDIYNNELNKYSDIIWYYRKIIIFGFLLLMIIILIFNLNFTTNIKIIIYICILLILVLYIITYNYINKTEENFTICLNKKETIVGDLNIVYDNYYFVLNHYLYYIDYLSGIKNNDDILKDTKINELISKLTIERQQKHELLKLKNINLENAIDIFKKTINTYYFYTTSIFFNIIILIISIILYLLFPDIFKFIIAIIVISIIISVYYINFNIHKRTRMNENKYYWSYLNPSNITLRLL